MLRVVFHEVRSNRWSMWAVFVERDFCGAQ